MKVLIAIILSNSWALAKECKYLVHRDVCDPKFETELLKPYNSQKVFAESKDLGSSKECLSVAEMAAKIVRPKQFRSKLVDQIYFDGQELKQTFEDKKECQ